MAQVIIISGPPRGGIGPLGIWLMTSACWAITGTGLYLSEHGQSDAINMALGAAIPAIGLSGMAIWASIRDVIQSRRGREVTKK